MKMVHGLCLSLVLWFSGLELTLALPTVIAAPANLPSPSGNGYNIRSHPALAQLAEQAPHDRQGHLLTLPPLTYSSLSDPLEGKSVLLAGDKAVFTIVPRASLLSDSVTGPSSKLILNCLPDLPYEKLELFWTRNALFFTCARLQPDRQGRYLLSTQRAARLIEENFGRIIVLCDASTGLPILHPQMEEDR